MHPRESHPMHNTLIPLSVPELRGNEWKYVKQCLDENWVSSAGKYVDLFEQKLAEYVGTRYAVATCNGTAALHTALMILGIGKGDEVIVPSLTFIATANVVRYVGAAPVFIDSEQETGNIDVNQVEAFIKSECFFKNHRTLINKKTGNRVRVIIPVHLYGYPAHMDALGELVKRYNLKVIEDASEALGSRYHGKSVGNLSTIGCFSFNGNKIITTGGGGMLTTNDQQLARRAKYITTQARDNSKQYHHSEIGYNYRLTNLQAAVGLAQLEKLDDYVDKKRRNALIYNQLLQGIEGIHLSKEEEGIFWNYWMYSIHIDKKQFGISKDELARRLETKGVQAGNYFVPLSSLPPYRGLCNGTINYAKKLHTQGLHLPSSVSLKKEEQIKIATLINRYHSEKMKLKYPSK